ncbi:MAG: aminoglycoside phosphotransferase, partial [Pseudomonadota bacterium]
MDPDIDGFLTCAGWGGADRAPLAGDASFRRYERIRQGDRRAVLMVAPPAKGEDTGPFVTITGLLHDLHLSAPQLL